ncbi:MAG: hypothetical protein ACE5IM_07835 [Nitrospinota bacterium]
MPVASGRRKIAGPIGWGLLTLVSVAFMSSGIGPIEIVGDALLALCLLKAGLKATGHVIGGGPRRRLRFGSKRTPPGANPREEPSPGR